MITAAILDRGIAPERVTVIEYDPDFAVAIAARFHGVRVIQGDAFDLSRTLGMGHTEPFAGIVSGIPLLNFPVPRRQAYVQSLTDRLAPGATLIQFSYGMHAPVAPPPGHTVALRRPGLGQSPAGAGVGLPEDLTIHAAPHAAA